MKKIPIRSCCGVRKDEGYIELNDRLYDTILAMQEPQQTPVQLNFAITSSGKEKRLHSVSITNIPYIPKTKDKEYIEV